MSGELSAIVVAGTHSGVGKTSVTLGLVGALRDRGLEVQPFKVGPDFIDPLHHAHASGRSGRNLDSWMLDESTNRERFARFTADADVAVVEGVMGLFDGSEGNSDRGSTAEIARQLRLPVVLVIDASAMARSAAALIHGFVDFDHQLECVGVILNNVGGEAHADMVRDAVDGAVPILGALPRDPAVVTPERHLGLHLPHEARTDYVECLAQLIADHIDLDALLARAMVERVAESRGQSDRAREPTVRIGVAHDEAFCFYYADNLELLELAGAELVEFSPLVDPLPPALDGLYIGGGYPELHAAALAANESTRTAIRELAASGRPVYAECGGLMYLAQSLELDGASHPLCGVLPFSTRMPAPLQIGYVEVQTNGGLLGTGRRARGHLFHHSEISGDPGPNRFYEGRNSRGEQFTEGYGEGNVLASYAHLHFASDALLAPAFVVRCAEATKHREGHVR